MRKKAYFGGGCFWCLEASFRLVKGVREVISGYAGGHTKNPTYTSICGGNTGHAEIVEIEYEPDIVRYEDLLDVFFIIHDPTSLNKQGNDIGTEYRSIVLVQNGEEQLIAEKKIQSLDSEGVFEKPIVTEIAPLITFYPAETYHQKYFEKNPDQAYCQFMISPKIAYLKEKMRDLLA